MPDQLPPIPNLIDDDRGAIISVELFVLSALAFIGLIVTISATRDAVVSELSDVAGSVQDSNQSYSYNGVNTSSTSVAGSDFDDALDVMDSADDASGATDNCITFDGAPANEKPVVADDDQVVNFDFEFGTSGGPTDTSPFGDDNSGQFRNGASVSGGALNLDGVNDYVLIPNSDDINLQTVTQRTINIEFTADEVTSTQVIFEEGGTIRGLVAYIENGLLYAGAYNFRETVFEAFLSTPVTAGVSTSVTLRLDASAAVQPGAFTAFINGQQFGSAAAAQVFPHAGAIGLGGVASNTVLESGVLSATRGNPRSLGGTISSFQVFNRALSDEEICTLGGHN